MQRANGAGTVLALMVVSAALATLSWVSVSVAIGKGQLEAQALADQIALAADDALRGKTATAPCQLAKQISANNSAELDSCRIVEQKVSIKLHLYRGFGFSAKSFKLSLQAAAEAAPSNP